MPYSIDLRQRVVSAIHSGMTRVQASEIYKVCRKTIYSWLMLEKETGSLEPITGFQNGHSHKITDHKGFQEFVDKHPDYTQEELADYFGVGSSTVGRTLKKIGYSRKKRVKPMQNEMKKNEMNTLKK